MDDRCNIAFPRILVPFITGFKTPYGTYAITGIFVLPLWLYGIQSGFLKDVIHLPNFAQYFLCVFLVGGRVLAFTTEVRRRLINSLNYFQVFLIHVKKNIS